MFTSEELLKKLKEQHDKRTVSVLVGAGFSKNAISSYPGWDELLRDLVLDVYGKYIKERYRQYKSGSAPYFYTEDAFTNREIERLINDVGYLNLVSKYIEQKGYREAIDVYIEEHLPYVEETGGVFKVKNIPHIAFNASNLDVHKEMLLCKWKQIYTTNYDNLLELTNDHYGMDYKRVIVDYELSNLSEHRGIVKVHGNLADDSLSSDYGFDNDKSRRYVISAEDYATYAEKHQAFSYQMKTGLLTGVFCLIGFSGNDPNFLGWLEWMKDVLDRDVTDQNKEKTKVFLLTLGNQKIEKSRQLFYQNHHIGIINILDDSVLKLIGMNPLSPKDVKQIFTLLFRYLNDGTSVVVNQSGTIATNTLTQYQRVWSNMDAKNVTAGDVQEVRRLRKSIVMPPDVTFQRMVLDTLYGKKDWTEQDAELFAIACMDCGYWMITLREAEKNSKLQNIPEWKILQEIGRTLQNEDNINSDNAEWQQYIDAMRGWYKLEPEQARRILSAWNATDYWRLNKAAVIATLDQAESIKLIDDYINTADDIERRYYASLLGNVITRLIPAKYSYNEFKAAGINGFIECKNTIIKNVRHKKEDIKPYGNTGKTFSLAKRLTDVDEALRFVLLLFQTGFPLQYKGHQIVTNDEWYDVFKRTFFYIPYPALYYSVQLTDKNLLRRIGQDYAYLEQLAEITPGLLKRLLKIVEEGKAGINASSCLWVAKEMLCSVSDNIWYDAAMNIFNKEVVGKTAMVSSLTPLYGFMHAVAFYLKDAQKKSDLFSLILEHIEEDIYFYSELLYQLQLKDSIVLTEEQKTIVNGILDRQPLNKTYLLAAHLGQCQLLDNEMQGKLRDRILAHPEEVEQSRFEELHSLTFITSKDEEALKIVKASILKKNIWHCGIGDNSATLPSYLALNKICRDIKWTEDEMRQIMDNLCMNLKLIESWDSGGDGWLASEHIGLLTDMLEFVEHDCISILGLKEFEPIVKEIREEIAKKVGGPELLDKIFDKEANLNHELQFLARCIDFYGVEKYRVYVDAIIDRALLQCNHSLNMMLAFVEFLVQKPFDNFNNEKDVYRLKLLLEKFVDVDYQELNLTLSSAYRCLNHVAKALKEHGLSSGQLVDYWLEDKFVSRFKE